MPRYKETERAGIKSETREKLLLAATQEFAREGYERASIDRISRSAGYAKGTVYNYFDSKRSLMLALIEEIAEAHFEYIAERVRADADPARRLLRFYEAGFAWVEENLAQGRVMFTTLSGTDLEFKQRMFEAYQAMFQLVAEEIITVGMQQGIFRQVEPLPTAGMLMTIYLGFGSQVDERGRPWLPPGQIAEFVLHSLRTTH